MLNSAHLAYHVHKGGRKTQIIINITMLNVVFIHFLSFSQYTKAGHLDHTWVSHRFLPDLGLPQYSSHFEAQLVDGRLLNVLTKKDMEKYLGMQKKFHQTSVLYGVELLRRLKYDKEVIYQTDFTISSFNEITLGIISHFT